MCCASAGADMNYFEGLIQSASRSLPDVSPCPARSAFVHAHLSTTFVCATLLFSIKQAFDSTVHFSTFFPLCALAATSENLVLVGNTERILIWNIVYSQLAIGNGGRRTAIEWTNGEYRLGRSPQKKGCSTSRRQHDIGQQERFRQRKRKYTD